MATKPKVYAAVLPSGRAVKFRRLTTFAALEIADTAGGKARQAKEMAVRTLLAVTRGAVPPQYRDATPEERQAFEQASEAAAKAAAEVGQPFTPPAMAPILDDAATLATVDAGAGGGWMELSEQDMRTANSGKTVSDLFDDEPADFIAYVGHVASTSGINAGGQVGTVRMGKPVPCAGQ